jgi:hypothetical protein
MAPFVYLILLVGDVIYICGVDYASSSVHNELDPIAHEGSCKVERESLEKGKSS